MNPTNAHQNEEAAAPFTHNNKLDAAVVKSQHQVIAPVARALIGQAPVRRLEFSDHHLYGRREQLEQLQNAYDKARRIHEEIKQQKEESSSDDDEATAKPMPSSFSSKQMVLLSGAAGTGKSALAAALRKRVEQTGGFYASGKFDQQRQAAEPYRAFDAAFSQLFQKILEATKATCEDDESKAVDEERETTTAVASSLTFRRIRNSIAKLVFSESGEILLSILPSLHALLIDDKESNELSPNSFQRGQSFMLGERAKHKCHFAFQRLVRITCRELPLVIVLDDLQWSDVSSLELLEALVTDRTLPGSFLLIGCYRNEERQGRGSPMVHRLETLLSDSAKGGDADSNDDDGRLDIVKIPICNLTLDAVQELVVGALDCALLDDKTSSLARIVHNKTAGNVFFVKEYLKSLVDVKLLEYQWVTARWNFDPDLIVSHTTVTDNVVDLMRNKIRHQLTEDCQTVLSVAACLGAKFEASKLALIFQKMHKTSLSGWSRGETAEEDGVNGTATTLHHLDVCVEEGLLERKNRSASSEYHFVHDQIQQASFSLVPENEQDILQYRIGEVLVDSLSSSELEEYLFVTVDLLNRGVASVNDTSRKLEFAKLNKRAGEKAMRSSAFTSAAAYLKQAISLLGPDHWEEEYAFSLELYSAASEAEYSSGNHDQLEKFVSEIVAQKERPVVDKLRAYRALLEALGSQNKFDEAIKLALTVLSRLGVKFPRIGKKLAVLLSLIKIKILLRGRSIDSLADLPLMQDEEKAGASRIMDKLGSFAYSKGSDLVPLIVFKMVRWYIQYGVCEYSPVAFASYGFILTGALGDFKGGQEFGKVALLLVERLKARKVEARVFFLVHTLINHWIAPVHMSLKPLFHAYNVGLETGDIESAMASISVRCYFALISGQPLSDVEVDLRVYSRQVRDCKEEYVLLYMLPSWQFVLNMMGKSSRPQVLTGEVMDVEVLLERSTATSNWNAVTFIKLTQLSLAYYLDEFEMAWSLVKQTQDIAKTCFAATYVWRHAYYEGLTAFALAHTTNSRRWETCARSAQQKIEKWTKGGNLNCLHMHHLFNAESASLQNVDKEEARRMYDLAISSAARCGILQDQVVATERAGEFFVATGDQYWATHYLAQAHRLYMDWGASAKADLLKRKHSGLI